MSGEQTEERPVTHEFESDICVHCGVYYEDALYGGVGCEAGEEGNNPAYRGSALTLAQQAERAEQQTSEGLAAETD